jgi:hypothetical protein
VYFDQRSGAAHPNAGQNSSKTTEFHQISTEVAYCFMSVSKCWQVYVVLLI